MSTSPTAIAITGMAGRFPNAANVTELWAHVLNGRSQGRRFTPEELRAAGVSERLIAHGGFVPVRGVMPDAFGFDAAFFGESPARAEVTDPQHRVFLETCWEALEDAACDVRRFPGRAGVVAGCSTNTYLETQLIPEAERLERLGAMARVVGNDNDHLATRVAYLLDLRGPAFTVQTACSTSLTAVHLACQLLLTWQCDLVLAGGASVQAPEAGGHLHRPGDIFSADGTCRPFDRSADGTYSGDGVGVVVLRRLEDALADGSPIRAVILGSALNNDGASRVGYTAPGLDGQAACIRDALAFAEVHPESIGFVEAHGTGTRMGDPIEVHALTQAWREHSTDVGWARLGSVKGVIGHLNAAAGIAGLIKAVLALQHAVIPPSPWFEGPNPELDLTTSPFVVNREAEPWAGLRRAAVSSLGAGGTNAHMILEQAPERSGGLRDAGSPFDGPVTLVLSARSAVALEGQVRRLEACLSGPARPPLREVSDTLVHGRSVLPQRWALRVSTLPEAGVRFDDAFRGSSPAGGREVALVFAGHGLAQGSHPGHEADGVFRREWARAAACIRDARETLEGDDAISEGLRSFCEGWAAARSWIEAGLPAHAVVGHSGGEYTAATVAGALDLPAGASLVAHRARLLRAAPPGAMLRVDLAAQELVPLLGDDVWIAIVNSPRSTVVSGSLEGIARVQASLDGRHVRCARIPVDVAFHSPLLRPVAEALAQLAAQLPASKPELRLLSGRAGVVAAALPPQHWAEHLLLPFDFAGAVALAGDAALVCMGGSPGLLTLTRRLAPGRALVPRAEVEDSALALWCLGAAPLSASASGPRLHLPTYPFERVRYWVEAPRTAAIPAPAAPLTPSARLAEIGARVLGLAALGLDDDLFAAGADSLATLTIVEALDRELGVQLPAHAAFQARSLRDFSAWLPSEAPAAPAAPETTAPPRCLVPFRVSGSRPPFYFVHPAAGVVFPYYPLARALHAEQPFYGVQAHGLDGLGPPDRTVEAMAERYVAALLEQCPTGPHRLGGYSFGALVAYEMAVRLELRGHAVEALILVDEPAPLPGHRVDAAAVARLLRSDAPASLLEHLRDFRGLRRSHAGGWRSLLGLTALTTVLPERARGLTLDLPAAGPMARLFSVHMRATFSYRPRPYGGKLLLLAAADSPLRGDGGWGKLAAGGVTLATVPGDHLSVLRPPNVTMLAAKIDEFLALQV